MKTILKSALGLASLLLSTGSPANWDLDPGLSGSAPMGQSAAGAPVETYTPALATPKVSPSSPQDLSVVEVVSAMIGVAEPDAPLLTPIDPAKAHDLAKAGQADSKAPLPIPAPPAIWLLVGGLLYWWPWNIEQGSRPVSARKGPLPTA